MSAAVEFMETLCQRTCPVRDRNPPPATPNLPSGVISKARLLFFVFSKSIRPAALLYGDHWEIRFPLSLVQRQAPLSDIRILLTTPPISNSRRSDKSAVFQSRRLPSRPPEARYWSSTCQTRHVIVPS